MRSRLTLFSFCLFFFTSNAQIISGPMLGQVEYRDAKIWVEVSADVKKLELVYSVKGHQVKKTIEYKGQLGKAFNPVQITAGSLEPGTTYTYQFRADNKLSNASGSFTTKELWQDRKPVPDFSFITGSCAYINDSLYEPPGEPNGKDPSIFETMSAEKSAFMLWLGDNWYTREVDYTSEWGLWYRAHHHRKHVSMQKLLKAMPHYATWDDHDFGPNDMDGHYVLKDVSRNVFMNYWANPSAGQDGEGIYTKFSYADADFFLCDGRWWRSADTMKDSLNGKPNPGKRILGEKQVEWLKNALLYSKAGFKFVVMGGQVLNVATTWDKLIDAPVEYTELMSFLEDNAINGVMFLTGDRHHSEINKMERKGTYPLYDITVSPLSSKSYGYDAKEINNERRIFGLEKKQNYARFSFTGPAGKRKLTVKFLGVKGDELGSWSIEEKDLITGTR